MLLREQQELPNPPDEVGLVFGKGQVLLAQELPVSFQHRMHSVAGIGHIELPVLYTNLDNHGIPEVMVNVLPRPVKIPLKNA